MYFSLISPQIIFVFQLLKTFLTKKTEDKILSHQNYTWLHTTLKGLNSNKKGFCP